ncbi:lactonase family protein [bacterium]|nr:lactonase family protein [bacterium]
MTRKQLVFVGTYTEPILFGTGKVLQGKGKGIHIYRFDEGAGRLEEAAVAEGIQNPSYLAFGSGARCLYAVNELKRCDGAASGALSAYAFDPESLTLAFLDRRLSGGTDPCHVAVDRSGRWAAVANYMSGSVSVYPIAADGGLGRVAAFVQHAGHGVNSARQAGPHAHAAIFSPGNDALMVPDLGIDRIVAYRFDAASGALSPDEARTVLCAPGVGPRSLEYHPSGRFAYAVNELASSVTAYAVDPVSGALSAAQTLSTLPDGWGGASTCADLHVAPSGKHLYASNRGHDSIAIFAIDESDGTLRAAGHESTRGATPRSFALDREGATLLAANQDSDSIAAFRVDAGTGKLEYAGVSCFAPTPVCVKFFEPS